MALAMDSTTAPSTPPASPQLSTELSTPLSELLARVESAGRPDRALDFLINEAAGSAWRVTLNEPGFVGEYVRGRNTEITASLDAALQLAAQLGFSGIDAAQLLHQGLEALANGGWEDDTPIGPQIALAYVAALLRAKIAA